LTGVSGSVLAHRLIGDFAEQLHRLEPDLAETAAKAPGRELVVGLIPAAQALGLLVGVVRLDARLQVADIRFGYARLHA